jgi:ribosomal protein L11 methyltransferase
VTAEATTFTALRFDVGVAEAERWSDALIDAGAMSVDLSDPHAGRAGETPIYDEPGEAEAALWPWSRLEALFAQGVDATAALREASRELSLAPPPYELGPVAERDWVRETQAQFAPLHVAGALWIVPSWCEPPHADALNLVLDPGLAFGTGAHPTTRLCLEWLVEAKVAAQDVLDYGCGSGILAIAAARLGARDVRGVDIDPQALRAAADNARANGVTARFAQPGAAGTARFDVVIANILANPLILLAPALAARVREGGRIALAGILDAQADAVANAYSRWFTLAPWRRSDGWVLIAGERREEDRASVTSHRRDRR